jgi:hypothetical protein
MPPFPQISDDGVLDRSAIFVFGSDTILPYSYTPQNNLMGWRSGQYGGVHNISCPPLFQVRFYLTSECFRLVNHQPFRESKFELIQRWDEWIGGGCPFAEFLGIEVDHEPSVIQVSDRVINILPVVVYMFEPNNSGWQFDLCAVILHHELNH